MSADNGIYILKTTANHRRSNENGCEMWTKTDSPISVWRVAHVQGIDNLGWYLENEIYNLGFYLHSEFGDSPIFYSENEADSHADKLQADIGYTEYGIGHIDLSNYRFPTD